MTQIVFDLDVLDRFVERLGGWPIPVLAGIFPLTSYRLALRLHNEVPGIIVPEHAPGRARATPAPSAAEIGMAHARELLAAAREPLRRASTSSRRTASRPRCSSCSPSAQDGLMPGCGAAAVLSRASFGFGLSARSKNSFGGAIEFSCWSTCDCFTSRRTCGWPGICSATAPPAQTSAKPKTAPTHGAADRVEQAQRRQQPQPAADERADERAIAHEHGGAHERAADAADARCSSSPSRRGAAAAPGSRPTIAPATSPASERSVADQPAPVARRARSEPRIRRGSSRAWSCPLHSPSGYTALRPGA